MFQHGVVALLGFGWRYVADGLQEPSVVEPVDPFEGGELEGLEVPPWSKAWTYAGKKCGDFEQRNSAALQKACRPGGVIRE